MNSINSQLDFLDALTIISFVLQLQNQNNIINIRDVQTEVDRAINEIHAHLEQQDEKIDKILKFLESKENK